jgi:hypothetical protein
MVGLTRAVALVVLSVLACGGQAADSPPGFGQACLPIDQQGDVLCGPGLVCVSVGAEQGRNLCTKTCDTEGAACTGEPSGTTPTCGREYQSPSGTVRVCEFHCDVSAPNCPTDTTCLIDFGGMTTCQPPIQ